MLLDVTTENNTLADIADGINSAQNNPGINASIVNATAGSYLILTSEKTGTGQPITITQSGGDGGLSVLEWDPLNGNTSLTESIAAQDAQIRIDGFDVVSQTNEFDTAVQGVTISIFAESFGATESLVVENDQEAVRSLVNDFVESYNALIETFDSLTAYNSESELAAPLLGDASIRGIRDQVRREMSEAVNDIEAPFSMLSDVGIETQLDGKLEINDTKLSEILAQDFAKFGQLFSTTDGFGTRLYDLADGYLNSGGIIETRTQGLEETIDGFTDDREALNERLASLETRLLRQFNALDSLLAQLSSTSNFLTQQLNSLPGAIRPDGN
jgi:flagellar hook-associated protein 2